MASAPPAQQTANQAKLLPSRRLWLEWRFLLFLALVLAPCFWQRRIQAGDLSSHLYNSWLALQIRSGGIHGLSIVPQWTNVLFDWLLTSLLAAFGAGPAQRIAVSLAVLVFAGGAFAFISAASSRRPWHLTPCLAVLAYDFVFHLGLFNFYLSLGICLWFLAAFWNGTARRRAAAAPLLLVAWLGHPLPVIWAVGTAAYRIIAAHLPASRRWLLLAGGIAALFGIQQFLLRRYDAHWTPFQIFGVTGGDQAFAYGRKYLIPMAGMLLVWVVWLRRIVKSDEERLDLLIAVQLLLLTTAGVALIPSRIDLPQYGHALVYVSERMSLPARLMLCVVLAYARVRRADILALLAVCVVFFGFLYADNSVENRKEDQVQALIQREIPRGARVVFLSGKKNWRFSPLWHVVDRACVGHCFSYANYEPATRQFRIRAAPGNGVVVTSYKDAYQIGAGDYVVRPQDLPLYQVETCIPGAQQYCIRKLQAGEANGQRPVER